MNANIHIRATGRVFRFGGVQALYSNGADLHVHVDMGDTVKFGGRLTNRVSLGVDEVTRFNLKDVSEVAVDDEPNTERFQVLA